MPEGRPAIPAELERQVKVEAGHRCAIPTCRQWPVEIDHIDDWKDVEEHRFENLIALCPTCHTRKGNGPGQIDRKSLRQYKANLSVVNKRYNDMELRILEYLAMHPGKNVIALPGGIAPVVQMLLTDRLLFLHENEPTPSITWELMPGEEVTQPDGSPLSFPIMQFYSLTDIGEEFLEKWKSAEKIEDA